MNDDIISRQAAIEAMNAKLEDIKLRWRGKVKKGEIAMYLDMRGTIETLPSAQPEIIRCIDCIHYTPLGKDKSWGRCSVHSSPTENQRMCQSCDFCAWAERRIDE